MRLQRIAAMVAFVGFLAGLAVALAASFGVRYGWWDFDFGLRVLEPGVGIGAVGLAGGIVWLVRALKSNRSDGWRRGFVGLVGAALVVGVPLQHASLAYTLPPIHDITTDEGDPPSFDKLMADRMGAPNPASYDGPVLVTYQDKEMTTALAQKTAYPDIRPVERLDAKTPQKDFVAKYFLRALNAAHALGWRVVYFDRKSGVIEATDRSFWFGLTSDIAVRVRPAGSVGVRVDLRAKSRVGERDGGRNADIIRSFMKKIG